MIGILIAVQLNNRNEVGKNKMKERTVLVSLSKDFHSNITTLDSSIITFYSYIDRIESCMNYVGLQSHDLSREMKVKIIFNAKHVHTSLVDGTLSSVLTSDNLELLGNEHLKSLITAYPAYVDAFYDTQNKAEFIVMNRHRPVLEQFITLADVLPENDERYEIIKDKGVQSDFTGLLNSLKYQNVLIDRLNMENDLIESTRLLRLRTKELINIVDRETGIIQGT